MRINSVSINRQFIPLTRPYTVAYKTQDSIEIIFVELHLENGLVGVGSASPSKYVTGETYDACQQALSNQLSDLVVGQDIRSIHDLCNKTIATFAKTPAACAAVDIALWDAFAKFMDYPMGKILGRVHKGFATSITIGIKETLEEAVEEAREYLERGFKIIKLKIGRDLTQDLEIIKAIKAEVKDSMLIRVDANQGYTATELNSFIQKTKDLGVEFIEQPFKPTALEETKQLDSSIRKVLAGDESIQLPQDALNCAAMPQPFGIYNIKLMKCGGITNGLQIAKIAQYAGIDLMWGCMDESCVSISAALHAALASPNTKYLDLDGSFDLAKDPYKYGFELKDGWLYPTDRIGLGVEIQ